MDQCPFCAVPADRIWIEAEHVIALADAYPVVEGHTLVIPRRHVASIYQLELAEQAAVWELVSEVRRRLRTDLKPDGFETSA